MLKLPKKEYLIRNNKELFDYHNGCVSAVNLIKYLCKEYGNKHAKETLSTYKEYYKGMYEYFAETEKLNEDDGGKIIDA